LDLNDELVESLKSQATKQNMPLEKYLDLISKSVIVPDRQEALSLEKFESLINEISEDLTAIPCLPSDFSRADIYTGRD
jgi:hypothetical protein